MKPKERIRALAEARQAGIDLDMLDTNLALSVKERWKQHDDSLNFAIKLRNAKLTADARLRTTSAAVR